VLVSAAISPRGAPRELILLWHGGAFVLVVSYELLLELQSVLLREKFRRYRPERDVLDYVLWLRENAALGSEGEMRPLSRDPENDYLLALARNSGADYLVSGDPDLRDLEEQEDLPAVVSPRQFADLVRRGIEG
jgi:putative PIN family toxin of toxin-antitoxin system